MKRRPRRKSLPREQAASEENSSLRSVRQGWPAIGVAVVVGAIAVAAWSSWWLPHAGVHRPEPGRKTPTERTSSRAEPALTQPSNDAIAPIPSDVLGLIEEAEQIVGRVAQRFPDDPFALDCAAKAQLYLGRTAEAAEYWERSLKLDPRAAFAWEGLGRTAATKGNDEAAVAHFRKALDVCPPSVDKEWRTETACQLAESLVKLGKTEEAISVLEDNDRTHAGSAASKLLLGQLRLQSGDYEGARKRFEEVIRIDATSSRAHFGLATALRRLGENDKSEQSMKAFRDLSAKESIARTSTRFKDEEPKELARRVAMTCTHAGQIYERHGDLGEAERQWRRAALMCPRNTDCRLSLAGLYLQTDRPTQAIAVYQELASIEPANPLYPWQIGLRLVRLGQLDAAETAFRQVIELSPDNAAAYAALAAIYLRYDRQLEEAKRLAQEAVRLEPTEPHYVLLSNACEKTGDRVGARNASRKAAELQGRTKPRPILKNLP